MTRIARQRCFNHPEREAAARCTRCGRHCCRECVIPHAELMICGTCLAAQQADTPRRHAPHRLILSLLLLWPLALLCLWLAFYSIGRLLVFTPSQVHDGKGLYAP